MHKAGNKKKQLIDQFKFLNIQLYNYSMQFVSHYELLCLLVTVMFVLTPNNISHKTGTKRTQAKMPEEEEKAEGTKVTVLYYITS